MNSGCVAEISCWGLKIRFICIILVSSSWTYVDILFSFCLIKHLFPRTKACSSPPSVQEVRLCQVSLFNCQVTGCLYGTFLASNLIPTFSYGPNELTVSFAIFSHQTCPQLSLIPLTLLQWHWEVKVWGQLKLPKKQGHYHGDPVRGFVASRSSQKKPMYLNRIANWSIFWHYIITENVIGNELKYFFFCFAT